MKLFEVLQLHDASIKPDLCKIHLAVWNGSDNPLDVYREGRFETWQARQSKRNFGRPLVVSLIALGPRNAWLFAGVHSAHNPKFIESWDAFHYQMSAKPETESLNGRLVIEFQRAGRQSYLNADRWANHLNVAELLAQRIQVVEFPGYVKVRLTKQQLDIIVRHEPESWKSALGSVAGVYVISDVNTGKLYVGSATGAGGIWSRWCAYAATGHGGNRELRQLLKARGPDYAAHFQFGVLETADTRASAEDVLARESHWKDLLLTRKHGLNAN